MAFGNFLDNPNSFAIIVGGIVSIIVLSIFAFLYKNNKVKKQKKEKTLDIWEPANSSSANRRSSIRREGQPVSVLISSLALGGEPLEAIVIDRSTGGLKLACREEVPVGSTLQVKAKNAPETSPWVTCVVRNYRFNGRLHELGVEFEITPPWNVLLLFG